MEYFGTKVFQYNILSALWLLVTWPCSTMASAITVLDTRLCVSSYLLVKQVLSEALYQRILSYCILTPNNFINAFTVGDGIKCQ